jgi:hypothetical protein
MSGLRAAFGVRDAVPGWITPYPEGSSATCWAGLGGPDRDAA